VYQTRKERHVDPTGTPTVVDAPVVTPPPKKPNRTIIGAAIAGAALIVVLGLTLLAGAFNFRLANHAAPQTVVMVTGTPSDETPTVASTDPLVESPTVTPLVTPTVASTDPPADTPTPTPTPFANTLSYFELGTVADVSDGNFLITSPARSFSQNDNFCFVLRLSQAVSGSVLSIRISREGSTVRSWSASGNESETSYVYNPGVTFDHIIDPALPGSYTLQVLLNGEVIGSIAFTFDPV
jgi:hypothetical protein